MRIARSSLLVVAVAGALASAAPAHALVRPSAAGRPDLDVRAGQRAAVPAGVQAARNALAASLGPQATVATDRIGGGLRSVGRTDGLLTGPNAGDPARVALDYARAHLDALGLAPADLGALDLAARSTSPDGVTHLTWRQQVAGIPAYDSELSVDVTADGRVVDLAGAPDAALRPDTTAPTLTPQAALAAARADVGGAPDAPRSQTASDPARTTRFVGGDSARLVVLAAPDGDRLGWRVTVTGEDPYVYDEVIDAQTGAVLVRHSLTQFAQAQVHDYHPGAPLDTTHVVDLAADPSWLSASAGSTRLSGNDAHAYSDVNDNDRADASEEVPASSGSDWLYPVTAVTPTAGKACPTAFPAPCTWAGDPLAPASANVNRAQVTTQAFYYVNTWHDWLAQAPIGFDDASHNFQANGTGGADAVNVETNDGGGTNNANMSTPADGSAPRMQMYLFTSPFPAVNGADDASVVYHEYTHGLTDRLVNNGLGNGLDNQQSGAMGEGWSDWYAMDYLVAKGLVADTAADGEVVEGAYVTDDTVEGIRTKPLDCAVGSTPAACGPTTTITHPGGYTLGDMGSVYGVDAQRTQFEVHADGEIWTQTLWDLRKAVGPAAARALITGGLRLSVSNPSFLEMRDAILREAQVLGGSLPAQVWSVFASRGFGYSARTEHSAGSTRAQEAFDLPGLARPGTPVVSDPAPLGDGDGIAEPGETVRLQVPVANPGTAPLTGVRATLSATGGAVVGEPTAAYGTVDPAGQAAGGTYAVTIPASQGCAAPVSLSLAVTSDQGAATLPVVLRLGSGRATATASSPAVPLSIPDGTDPQANYGPGPVVSSALAVTGDGAAGPLEVRVTLNHTWTSDLDIELVAPDGTRVALADAAGSTTAGRGRFDGLDVTFSDAATQRVQDIAAASGVVSGAFRPNQPLARLAGAAKAGTWSLRLHDDYNGDVGTLTGWSLTTNAPACATTAPATPVTATGAARDLAPTTATLAGTLDPKGADTTYRYDVGTSTAYGSSTPVATATGTGVRPVAAALTGLAAQTTYHARLVALRGSPATVVALGDDVTFTTPAVPTTTTTTTTATSTTTPTTPTTTSTDPATTPTTPSGPATTTTTADAGPPVLPTPQPTPVAPTGPTLTTSTTPARLRGASVKVDARGRLTLQVSASGATGRVTVALRAARRGKVKAYVVVRSARATLAADGTATVKARLSRGTLAKLRRAGSAKVTLTVRLATGATLTRALTVRVARR